LYFAFASHNFADCAAVAVEGPDVDLDVLACGFWDLAGDEKEEDVYMTASWMGALSAVLLLPPAASSRKHLRGGAGFGCAVIVDAVVGSARVGWALDVAPLLEARAFEAALSLSLSL
jgi:hypothetical protein